MKKIIYAIIIILLIATLIISNYFLYKNKKEDKEQEDIFENIIDIAENTDDTQKNEEINMQELYNINNDIVGWIKIDNTNISYPVMQTKENPNYYLRKNFYKKYSLWGTPFLAENCDIKSSDNLIIYGHHINNSKMFGELEKYKDEEFCKSHNIIKFYTMEDKSEYEIISVLKTVVYDSTGFQYYKYINFNNKDEFDTFIDRCNELSFFSFKEKANYKDKLLTLSTCEYSKQNGRLVIIAKKIN